jgi:hypothetical protein
LDLAGLEVKEQDFAAITRLSPGFDDAMDGILGLGWPELSVNSESPPFQNLAPQLDANLFTVWLDRHIKPSQGRVSGLITCKLT